MNVICHDFVVMLNDFSYFCAHGKVFDSGTLITMIAEIFQPLQERRPLQGLPLCWPSEQVPKDMLRLYVVSDWLAASRGSPYR